MAAGKRQANLAELDSAHRRKLMKRWMSPQATSSQQCGINRYREDAAREIESLVMRSLAGAQFVTSNSHRDAA